MRMVVVLFAEARELLPGDNPIYHSSYGLQGLRELLERAGGGAALERFTPSLWGVAACDRIIPPCLRRIVTSQSSDSGLRRGPFC